MSKYLALFSALILVGCQPAQEEVTAPESAAEPAAESGSAAAESLASVLDAQHDEVRARYQYRHPQETLEFFGIEPGMTVVEGLPGRGWYTKVLLPYLGSDGELIGVNYPIDMWPLFQFGTPEFIERMTTWTTDFPAGAEEWRGEDGASVSAFIFGSMPDEMAGTADAVFFARVLHNLARFENEGEGVFLSSALADAYRVLKPSGVFGVVQHHARDDMSDDFANGSHGYLKKSWLIEQAEAAGFEFVAESDINANPNDMPTEEDVVWRLPPSYRNAGDDADARAEMDAIGESNRMTLKFVKPQ